MATLGDDCYFFCTSTCVKGPSCPFRHVEAAKTCKIVCQHWQMGVCSRQMCKFRHSTFPIPVSNLETPCYWETQPIGCIKKACPFKHSKPRPTDTGTTTQAQSVTGSSGSSQDSVSAMKPDGTSQVQTSALSASQEGKDATTTKPSSQESIKVDPTEKSSSTQNNNRTTPEEKDSSSNKENGNNAQTKTMQEKGDATTTTSPGVKKKIVKKVAVKKNAAGSAVKKTKIVKKVPVKKKVVKKVDKTGDNNSVRPAPATAATKSVRERLGVVSAPKKVLAKVAPPAGNESGSESGDSVDNIKVLSMEEILRQKALESMMRKRAAGGKPVPGTETTTGSKSNPGPAKASVKKATPGKIILKKKPQVPRPAVKPVEPVRKKKIVPVRAPESSESEEESSAESSSSSGSEESDSPEDSEPDVRRVVVEVDTEAAARKRAKASLLKKQAATGQGVQAGKINKAKGRLGEIGSVTGKKLKRRMVNVGYDSDGIISSRVKAPLSVKDRLGKPPQLHHASSSSRLGCEGRQAVLSESPRKTVILATAKATMKDSSSSNSSGEEEEGIRVKTLEEIRLEKMSKAAGRPRQDNTDSLENANRVLSVKQRLGSVSPVRRNVLEDDGVGGGGGSRQVLIATDTGSKSDEGEMSVKMTVDQRKAKRRPWRSKKNVTTGGVGNDGDGDERTAVVISDSLELDDRKEESVEESPFARLKRRALQKKLQNLQQSKESTLLARTIIHEALTPEGGIVGSEGNEKEQSIQLSQGEEEGEVEKEGHKKHKHKHKHKHHKRSKKERQIYMPPALKNAVQEPESTPASEQISPVAATSAPTIKVAPQRRAGPHPIAAAWAAGLSLSSKGTTHSARRPVATSAAASVPAKSAPVAVGGAGVVGRLGLKPAEPLKKRVEPFQKLVAVDSSQSSSEPTGVAIKSFSEIMAEKRRRRLELQANQGKSQSSASPPSSSSSQPSTVSPHSSSPSVTSSPIKAVEWKPRVPISPSVTSSPMKAVESKPRVPISPVVFSTDNQSASLVKPKVQAKWSGPVQPSPESSSVRPAEQVTRPISTNPSVQFIPPPRPPHSQPIARGTLSLSSSAKQTSKPQQQVTSIPELQVTKTTVPALKQGAKKSLGQKKLFKKKKPVDPVVLSRPSEDVGVIESMGISIPLPPMTWEEELLLDDGPELELDMRNKTNTTGRDRLHQTEASGVQSSAGPELKMFEHPMKPVAVQPLKQHQSQPGLSVSVSTPVLALPAQPAVSSVEKHKLSPTDGSEVSMKKIRLSLDDEFSLFDEDMESFGGDPSLDVGDSVEPIDDLLQNIDELLA